MYGTTTALLTATRIRPMHRFCSPELHIPRNQPMVPGAGWEPKDTDPVE